MILVWNAQSLNRLKAKVESHYAKRIAKAASRLTGMKFTDARQHGTHTVQTHDPEARRREYGDGVAKAQPWANAAIAEGVGRGRND